MKGVGVKTLNMDSKKEIKIMIFVVNFIWQESFIILLS